MLNQATAGTRCNMHSYNVVIDEKYKGIYKSTKRKNKKVGTKEETVDEFFERTLKKIRELSKTHK